MIGYTRDWVNAWTMLQKVTEQVFDDCGRIYYKKQKMATYKKAKKREMTSKYFESTMIMDTIDDWYNRAIYNNQSCFKIYNKYNVFSYERLINFFKNPNWETAQVIACSAILTHKVENDEIYSDIINGNDKEYNRFEISKQWVYHGRRHATTIYGHIITTNISDELPTYFYAKYIDGKFSLKK